LPASQSIPPLSLISALRKRRLTFCRYWRDKSLITITLEGTDETYSIPGAMLCLASPYFGKALDGPFYEAESRKINLPGCDSDIFQLFLFWLVHDGKPIHKAFDETSDHNDRMIRL
jgi:hypothetical protein